MVRIQLQLDEDTNEALRRRAFEEKKSLSAVAREVLREGLTTEHRPGRVAGLEFSFIGSGSSGKSDISVRHDDYLIEDFGHATD